MLLQLFYATPVKLVLWMCISFTVGGPLSEDTTTAVVLPMKFVKSSMDTSKSNTAETNDANDEIVRATEPIRSPGSIGVNFYRLPPSPANLLKPDGFQFYTYNERGDMITRQMTMQEIQALIAGGGPGHSNAEIQGPQKVEDILTGGKKVIDVVEKVQNVLKSAMDKPLSALSGSHLTIPEKANVEWSNILPGILAGILTGDKYGNKVDENNHVEEATLKPMSTLAVQNVSFSDPKEGNASGTVGSTVLENVTKGTVQNEETTGQTENDGTHAASSTVKFETATSPYTEKLMIPVAVVTTERNTEQVIVTQHTTHSYSFHTITEVVPSPSLENVSGEHYSRGPEGVTTATNVDTGSTTITPSVESTGSSGTDTEFASATSNISLGETLKTHKGDADKDASIEEEYNVSSKTQTSSMSGSNKLEPSSTMPSHRTTSSDSLVATFITETSTIGHGVVRKPTGTPPTQHFKPLPVETVVNSLSSAIGQVSEDRAPSVSAVSPDLESPDGDTDNGKRSNGTGIVTLPPTNERDEEKPVKANDTFGKPAQNSFAGTTSNAPIDQQQSSTESWTKSVVANSVSSVQQSSLNRTETTTGMEPSGITITPLNPSGSSETKFTTDNWNLSKPVETIDSILRTVSTDAVASVTESVTIPNKLTEGFSINTLASALIAGFDGIDSDRTEIAFNGTTTTQSWNENNSTVASTALNNIVSAAANDSTGNADRTEEADSAKKNENRYTFTSTAKEHLTDSLTEFSNSVEEGATLDTTDRAAPLTRTSIENSQSESELWSIAEHTTAKSFAAAAPVENMLNAGGNTLNSMEEDAAVNRNTEAVGSWSTESVNFDATDKFGTGATVAVTPDSSPIPERNCQVTSQNEGENLGAHGNDTAEIPSAEHNQHRNETIESFDATRTYPNETESTVASIISTEYDTTESSATKRGSTDETSEANGRITSTTHESNVGTNAPTGTEVLGGLGESENQVKENANERESTTQQSNANSTDTETNSHHAWQEISLQETKSTTPTRPASGSKETEEMLPSTATTEPGSMVDLDALKGTGGLDSSTRNASTDIANFSQLCNELAMKFWIATNKGLSTGRSLALSPFGMISLLSMIFLGARGSTSDEMNQVLGLDNVATFNPHLVFQNITDTVSLARQQGIANAAFVRELFADKAKVRKLLPFYKEQAQQFYEGLVAEVNFATISDLVRRRTNLLVRKQTGGRIKDFAKSNAVTLRSPLAAISANVFQTDCNTSSASTTGRDGELYFAVSSAHRSRKLIPVPATVWRSNVLAGYEPSLDATAIALGGVERLVSTIFLLPGQQGHVAPGDTLDRLEQRLAKGAFRDGSWQKVLKVLIPRPGLEAQIPKFTHRSVVNATAALKRMGLDQLFSKKADFKGINGIGNRLFLSDVLQMNLFSTCGDESIANGRHHVEIYPAGPSLRNSRKFQHGRGPTDEGREYRENPSKWVTRAAERTEAKPRLKLDQPFLYFVRHNPTGIVLHMGRFNPRLL